MIQLQRICQLVVCGTRPHFTSAVLVGDAYPHRPVPRARDYR